MKHHQNMYCRGEQRQAGDIVHKTTVACVTNQFHCERIIKAGRVIANISNTELLVINVSPTDFSKQNGEAIQYLFNVSKENDAVMSVIYSDEPLKALTGFLKRNNTVNVVTGMPQKRNSVLEPIWSKFSHISFFTVNERGSLSDVAEECTETA